MKSQTRPSGHRRARGESVPVAAATTPAASVVTAHVGSDARIAAVGKANREQGVKRTSMLLEINELAPMIIDAWKNAQTLRPTSANTEYGIPGCTSARFRKATKNAASSASGWKTSHRGP